MENEQDVWVGHYEEYIEQAVRCIRQAAKHVKGPPEASQLDIAMSDVFDRIGLLMKEVRATGRRKGLTEGKFLDCTICHKKTRNTTDLKFIKEPNEHCNYAFQLDCGHWMFDDCNPSQNLNGACIDDISRPLSKVIRLVS